MGAAQALKRIPRIKFPRRHPKPSGSGEDARVTGNASQQFSRSEVRIAATQMAPGGKASLQPKRIPMSNEEIEAILMGGCI